MLKISFVYFLVILARSEFACSCELSLKHPLPLFTKQLGSRKVVFEPQTSSINVLAGESITAYCSGGLVYEKKYDRNEPIFLAKNTADFICDANNVLKIGGVHISNNREIIIFCASQGTYDLYESKKTLPNCEKYMSYAIGVPIDGEKSEVKAGVCFDLDNFTLKYIHFITEPVTDRIVIDEKKKANELSLDLNQKVGGLTDYFPFMSVQKFNATRNELLRSRNLFDIFDFDLDSLLQDESQQTKLNSYAYLFNTLWWRQLRQQNWRHFLEALNERTRVTKYLVYMGTHGIAMMPSKQRNCSLLKSDFITVRSDQSQVTAPAYIWIYLKSLRPSERKEDIVVIAHNSPYVANPGSSEFCEVDVCDEVEWLKNSNFGYLRQIPTLGYTFCCRPKDVAKVIPHFPISANTGAATEVTRSTESSNSKLLEIVTGN